MKKKIVKASTKLVAKLIERRRWLHLLRTMKSVPGCKIQIRKQHSMFWRKTASEELMANFDMDLVARKALTARADEIIRQMKAGTDFPFSTVIKANAGDTQAMGLRYITFIRQVLACITYPPLMETRNIPDDVKERARAVLDSCSGNSIGAYSSSTGIELVRKNVAAYLSARDGVPASARDIILTNGAIGAIKYLFTLFANHQLTDSGKPVGVMVPVPNNSLYKATCQEYGLDPVEYYLDDKGSWSVDLREMERAYRNANHDEFDVKVLLISNPGNPTGHVLSEEKMKEVIKFARCKDLFIIADEIYQDNVYNTSTAPFHSFKKVLTEMGPPYFDMELASVSSVSKGYAGECGVRGGWVELCNLEPDARAQLHKLISVSLGSSTLGQVAVDCVVNPPRPGDHSYQRWAEEKNNVMRCLQERAKILTDGLNDIDGIKCNPIQGALFAFPEVTIPMKAMKEARRMNLPADVHYAFSLLERNGICVVPGSGFGQRPSTHHLRTSIVPQKPLLLQMLDGLRNFHKHYNNKYS